MFRSFLFMIPLCGFLASIPAAEPIWNQFGGPTGDYVSTAQLPKSFDSSAIAWRVPIGLGESSVVGDGTRLYTMAGKPSTTDKTKGTEQILALNPKDGKTVWEHQYEVSGLPAGETPVKGGHCGPQATPCLYDGKLFGIGYTGRVTALECKTGKPIWEKELAADFGGAPPEFGFASSPVMVDDLLLIPVGGKKTALVAVDPNSGQEKWRTSADAASCCTPQIATLGGKRQIVHLSRNALHGYSIADGAELWSYKLPLPGLTNVPSPLLLPDDRIIISGQGVKGMQLLKITCVDEKFSANLVWKGDPQFFYCNWGVINNILYGYGGTAFVAVNLKDGEVIWSDKNQKEANWILANGVPLVLRGDGQLARCQFNDTGVEVSSKLQATNARTWTPPSIVGNNIYVRNTTELVAVSLSGQ
jgi:outer membrane protein assembly factor BamB